MDGSDTHRDFAVRKYRRDLLVQLLLLVLLKREETKREA